MFKSLFSDLKVSENKAEPNFYPVSTQPDARTISNLIFDVSCNSEESGPCRVTRPSFLTSQITRDQFVSVAM